MHGAYAHLMFCRLQELMSDDQREAGRIPRTIECELVQDLVDSCVPGDMVTITGIVKVSSTEEGKIHHLRTPFPSDCTRRTAILLNLHSQSCKYIKCILLQKFPKFYNKELFWKSPKQCCPRGALSLMSADREGLWQPTGLWS